MADFCTKCSNDMFGDEVAPDIDVLKEFNELKNGYCISCLCEGCTLSFIGKDGENILLYYLGKEEPKKYTIDEYVKYSK